MQAVGISHRGKVRPNNEDSYLIDGDDNLAVFAVADGMGGHAAGEVASSLALTAVQNYLAKQKTVLLSAAAASQDLSPLLQAMLANANETVLHASRQQAEYAGMGTTLTLLISLAGQRWLAHIGDSRAYLLRNGQLIHITEDHTLVSQLVKTGQIREEERDGHPQRNVLTRALGTDDVADFDLIPLNFEQDDLLLLCSDGLYGMLSNEEIKSIIEQKKEPAVILQELVAAANDKGGIDNITVVLVYNF
ncbi:MAG: Stp1/IreP family PP2C-type Ser/Thr phosphatase [Firmicutes bacterium]|nr:Stp1/IreP family PP2C-type Ser/Thr phosphatase [Bacillota bacterium]